MVEYQVCCLENGLERGCIERVGENDVHISDGLKACIYYLVQFPLE